MGDSVFTPPPNDAHFLKMLIFCFQKCFKLSDIIFVGQFDLPEHVYDIISMLEDFHSPMSATTKIFLPSKWCIFALFSLKWSF